MSSQLDIRKIYVDTKFKTADSKSDSDFYIDLPRTLQTSENTKAFIDEIAIPNVMKVIDARNQKLYVSIFSNDSRYDQIVTIPTNNYSGVTFASALQTALNSLATLMQTISMNLKMQFTVTYDYTNNNMNITLADNRTGIIIIGNVLTVKIYSDADIMMGVDGRTSVNMMDVDNINEVISLQRTVKLTKDTPFNAVINLRSLKPFTHIVNIYRVMTLFRFFSKIQ